MNVDLEQWLSRLPIAEEQAADGIVLSGCLLPSEAGGIRMLVGELCLSFCCDDILEIEPVAMADRPLDPSRRAIRVVVRRGAPILDIRPDKLCEGLLPQRRPFALSLRPPSVTLGPSIRFRELERLFLVSHGLTDA